MVVCQRERREARARSMAAYRNARNNALPQARHMPAAAAQTQLDLATM
jgi:hypothetical protein